MGRLKVVEKLFGRFRVSARARERVVIIVSGNSGSLLVSSLDKRGPMVSGSRLGRVLLGLVSLIKSGSVLPRIRRLVTPCRRPGTTFRRFGRLVNLLSTFRIRGCALGLNITEKLSCCAKMIFRVCMPRLNTRGRVYNKKSCGLIGLFKNRRMRSANFTLNFSELVGTVRRLASGRRLPSRLSICMTPVSGSIEPGTFRVARLLEGGNFGASISLGNGGFGGLVGCTSGVGIRGVIVVNTGSLRRNGVAIGGVIDNRRRLITVSGIMSCLGKRWGVGVGFERRVGNIGMVATVTRSTGAGRVLVLTGVGGRTLVGALRANGTYC